MISEIIEKWIKGILIDGITGNLSGLFDNVNAKVGEIASDVGSTPQAWNSGIFNMLRSLSETVVLPIAAAILALVMCHELIQMITEKNNMHDFDTSMFFRWIFKSAFAILIVSNTWNIVMGVFDATQSVVKMDGCFTDDNAGTLVDNALGGIEHTHNDIPCVADYEDGKGRLENPAEEHGSIEVVHIVLFGNHLDKLMAHHKGKDSRCNGQHHRFGKVAQHIEDTTVPCLRSGANVGSDFAHLGVHVVEQA